MVHDRWQRPLRKLRVSVTDRCNLRCSYCMPETDYLWLPRQDLLSFEEIGALVDVFGALGVDEVRLTGGEPLLRRDLHVLVRILAGKTFLKDLALTTNGVLLAEQAHELRRAGLRRVTVSVDTLRRDRFRELTRRDELERTLRGVEAARAEGFTDIKINAVVMRGVNDDELDDLLAFGKSAGAEVRFIEYMDVGGATRWSPELVVSRREMLERLGRSHGRVTPLPQRGSAPAERFELSDGTRFGIIASTTEPFCAACDRSRLTADGRWFLCLYALTGIDLREPLRAGASAGELRALIAGAWQQRDDRGAEQRLRLQQRAPLAASAELRQNPHLEMHKRGG